MAIYVETGKLLLFALTIFGVLGTWKFAFDNGTFGQIEKLIAQQDPTIPGTILPLGHRWTGVARIDELSGTILAFFLPIIRGQLPKLTVQALHFNGQLIASWMLMIVECSRTGNAWKAISFATLWGLLMENVAMAIALPAWCLVYLMTSTTVLHSDSVLRRQTVLLVHPVELRIMPWAVLAGCGIPSIMAFNTIASAAKPFYLSQQFWALARMLHPLFTAIVQLAFSIMAGGTRQFASVRERNYAVLKNLRRVYTAATMAAVVFHISTLTLSLSSQLVPLMFNELYRTLLGPREIFEPPPFWTEVKDAKSIVEGVHAFLQWDELVSCSSILIWAFVVNRNALRGESDSAGLFSTLTSVFLWLAVGGPAAAAIKLIQQRDEYVLEYLEPSQAERESAEKTMAKRKADKNK